MNILYHHRTRFTDAQRIHILELVRSFTELKHQVRIVSLVGTEQPQNVKRDAENPLWQRLARAIPFTYELTQLGYNLLGIPLLLFHVLRHPVDFIYERYSLFNISGVFVAKLCRIPIVLEVNSPFAIEQSRDKHIRLNRLAQLVETWTCNAATRIIVVSTPLKRILAGAGVSADRIEVMPNGVRMETFVQQPAPDGLRNSLGLGPETRIIGFVGWFRKWHGIEMLLDAFRISGVAKQGVKVMLLGDGQAMADLRQYVAENGMQQDVIFTGPLPHHEVPAYLNLIDIAVQPAANEYCCPMKILEYMALGKPIVAPRQANIEELLRNGQEARLFEPGNAGSLAEALRAMIADLPAAQRMGERAREAIGTRGLLWNENARRVIELVRTAAGASPDVVES
jgi:glycosyltransferase involved in cell wall biosynthesis